MFYGSSQGSFVSVVWTVQVSHFLPGLLIFLRLLLFLTSLHSGYCLPGPQQGLGCCPHRLCPGRGAEALLLVALLEPRLEQVGSEAPPASAVSWLCVLPFFWRGLMAVWCVVGRLQVSCSWQGEVETFIEAFKRLVLYTYNAYRNTAWDHPSLAHTPINVQPLKDFLNQTFYLYYLFLDLFFFFSLMHVWMLFKIHLKFWLVYHSVTSC